MLFANSRVLDQNECGGSEWILIHSTDLNNMKNTSRSVHESASFGRATVIISEYVYIYIYICVCLKKATSSIHSSADECVRLLINAN
jgi:hypothetical protein